MQEFEQYGSKVITHDDGTLEIINKSGASIKVAKDGSVVVNLEKIEAIGVKTIIDVISHRIMRDEDSTIHQIEFVNSGTAKISYTHTGKLKSFECSNISTTLTPSSEIILSARNS